MYSLPNVRGGSLPHQLTRPRACRSAWFMGYSEGRVSCGLVLRNAPALTSLANPGGRLLPAINILDHTLKSCRPEGLFSSSWILVSGGRSSASGSDLARSTPLGQSSNELRFCLPHFTHRCTSSKRLGRELRGGYSAKMSGMCK